MSPASKSKSKDKSAAKSAKEQSKASSSKPSGTPAYNPVSGTFHALEIAPSTSPLTPQNNGRFRNIDETDDHSSISVGTAAEYDSVSNNDSCSGESEDQQKEKSTGTFRADPIPGADIEKREKIRLKNEKKHQRQKERRALELHERCCSYLTSRKLENLAQKLVAMGFTVEQATMALIRTEGRVEESVLWLVDRVDESEQGAPSNVDGTNAKIDIADELARVAELELKFKYTRQEVERAVVACEGDLEKAEATLKAQRQEPPATPPKLEESSDHNNNRLTTSSQNSTVRTQVRGVAPGSVQIQRRDDRDFNYTKSQVETPSRNLLPTMRKVQIQSKPSDWIKVQPVAPTVDKRRPGTSSSPSTPFTLSSSQANPETWHVPSSANEVKNNLLAGTMREPIFVMQRPQSNGTRQNVPLPSVSHSASPPASTGWYPGVANGSTAMDMMKLAANGGGIGQQLRNLSLAGSGANSQHFYPQSHHHQQQFLSSSPGETVGSGWSGGSYSIPATHTRSSASLAVPSSLGLFTGWGSSGTSSSSPVDWNTRGLMRQCDYTSIDWSLDSTPLSLPSSSIKAQRLYDNSWHSSYTTPPPKAPRQVVNGNGNGNGNGNVLDGSLVVDHHPAPPSGGSSHEWTSPFTGKDLLRVPRQYVTFPSP